MILRPKVCPKIYMPHIWMIFYKNTHTFETSAIEILKGTRWHIIIFHSKIFLETETDFFHIYIFSSFKSYMEYLAKFFNVIIWVPSSLLQMKIPVEFFIFNRVLKTDKLERCFKGGLLGYFYTLEWTSFEPIGTCTCTCIYKYMSYMKTWKENLGTDYRCKPV